MSDLTNDRPDLPHNLARRIESWLSDASAEYGAKRDGDRLRIDVDAAVSFLGRHLVPRAPSPSRDQGTSDARLIEIEKLVSSYGEAGMRYGATNQSGAMSGLRTDLLAAIRSALEAERSRATEAERARDEAVRVGLESTRTHEADLLRWTSERDALRVKAYEAERRLIAAERRAEAAERLMKAAAPLANADIIGISVPAVASDDVMTRWHNAVRAVCREVRALAASPSRKGDATPKPPSGEGDDACPFCRGNSWATSATLIRCRACGVIWGRCDGSWRVDPRTIPPVLRAPATPSNEETTR